MNNRYHNEPSISTGVVRPDGLQSVAFLAGNQPVAAIREMAERCGVPMDQAVFLSVKDDPTLRTPAGILAALPGSITWMLITDAEFLLPANRRSREAVRDFLLDLERLAFPREIAINASHGLGSPGTPTVSFHSLNPGGGAL